MTGLLAMAGGFTRIESNIADPGSRQEHPIPETPEVVRIFQTLEVTPDEQVILRIYLPCQKKKRKKEIHRSRDEAKSVVYL